MFFQPDLSADNSPCGRERQPQGLAERDQILITRARRTVLPEINAGRTYANSLRDIADRQTAVEARIPDVAAEADLPGHGKSYADNSVRDFAKLLLDSAHKFKPELGCLGAHLGKRPAEKSGSFNIRHTGSGVVSQIANVHIRPRLTRVELQLTDSGSAAHRAEHIVVAWCAHEGFAFFVKGSPELLDTVHRTGRIAVVKGAVRGRIA